MVLGQSLWIIEHCKIHAKSLEGVTDRFELLLNVLWKVSERLQQCSAVQ